MSAKFEYVPNTLYPDNATIKYGDTTVSFVSAAYWIQSGDLHQHKTALHQFINGESDSLAIQVYDMVSNNSIVVSNNTFTMIVSSRMQNFTITVNLSCAYEENKEEILKFLNYLYTEYEKNVKM